MAIDRVLAVVPVSDVIRSSVFYELVLGAPPRNRPMGTLVEWQLTESAWLQVFLDPERAGSSLVNFSVDDLATHVAGLEERGLQPSSIDEVTKGVTLSSIVDPDGNRLTFIGNFREEY
jgi:hypothetical protein